MIGSRTPVIASWYLNESDHGEEHYLSLVEAADVMGVTSVDIFRAINECRPIQDRYFDYDIVPFESGTRS